MTKFLTNLETILAIKRILEKMIISGYNSTTNAMLHAQKYFFVHRSKRNQRKKYLMYKRNQRKNI